MANEPAPLNPSALALEAPAGGLASFPPVERWDDWTEYDPAQWPRKVEKHYSLIPTLCFNCEAGCGLLAYVDQQTNRIRKFEGNPAHPGSRGRNCAKGPATLNQINDPERILYPLKRIGNRGEGKWERVTWDEVLDDLAGRIRTALIEGRRNEIVYHVGRPANSRAYWTPTTWRARSPRVPSYSRSGPHRMRSGPSMTSCSAPPDPRGGRAFGRRCRALCAALPTRRARHGRGLLLCSGYKFYGPHVGVLYSKPGALERLPTDRLRVQDPAAPSASNSAR